MISQSGSTSVRGGTHQRYYGIGNWIIKDLLPVIVEHRHKSDGDKKHGEKKSDGEKKIEKSEVKSEVKAEVKTESSPIVKKEESSPVKKEPVTPVKNEPVTLVKAELNAIESDDDDVPLSKRADKVKAEKRPRVEESDDDEPLSAR